MREHFISFFKKISLVTLFSALLAFVAKFLLPTQFLNPHLFYILLFFYLFNLLIHFLLLKFSLKKIKQFPNFYLGSILIKLMSYMGIIVWYAFMFKSQAVSFIISFFIFYVVFTVMDVIILQAFVRKIK